jgi:hypothetical protein
VMLHEHCPPWQLLSWGAGDCAAEADAPTAAARAIATNFIKCRMIDLPGTPMNGVSPYAQRRLTNRASGTASAIAR